MEGVAVIVAKLAARIYRPGSPMWGYRTGDIAYAMARGQAAYYRILETRGQARVIETSSQLSEHMAEWAAASDYSTLPVGMIVGIEGADPILWPEQVHEWWDVGVRVVSLSHYGVSTYSHGTSTGTDGGLFAPAKDLLQEMEALGMVLDVTHTSDESVRQAMDLFAGPVVATHQNCRALVPGERQFPDELLNRVIERGGVIGTSLDAFMLYRPGIDWLDDSRPRDGPLTGKRSPWRTLPTTWTMCASSPATRCTPHWAPTSAEASAGAGRHTGWTRPPTTTRSRESSHDEDTARMTSRTSCTATGSASTRSGCPTVLQ